MTIFDKQLALDVMLPAAQAAYTVMKPGAPVVLPSGYTIVRNIVADLSKEISSDVRDLARRMVTESPIFGAILWNEQLRALLITIRGTQTGLDWIADLDIAPVRCSFAPSILVHAGFQLVEELIWDSVLTGIGAAGAVNQLFVDGHSLGGAVARLIALRMRLTCANSVRLYTFAAPNVIATAATQYFNSLIPDCQSIEEFGDIVPQVPTPPLYDSVGSIINIHGSDDIFDPLVEHSLTTYDKGLERL